MGACDGSKVKTDTRPKVEKTGQPIAEYTQLGWTLMSPERESDTNLLWTWNLELVYDHNQLCRFDIRGVEDLPTGNRQSV